MDQKYFVVVLSHKTKKTRVLQELVVTANGMEKSIPRHRYMVGEENMVQYGQRMIVIMNICGDLGMLKTRVHTVLHNHGLECPRINRGGRMKILVI
jgi:hypothetical protein